MRLPILIALLMPLAAHAQLDQCLGVRSTPSVKAVGEAWKAALAGEAKPERFVVSSHPCFAAYKVAPPTQVTVSSCSADASVAVVSVGACQVPREQEPIDCGAAVFDLRQSRFTTYLPPVEGQATRTEFFGNALVRAWAGGAEVRHGKSIRVIAKARPLDVGLDANQVLLAIGGSGHERLASLRAGGEPVFLTAAHEEVDRLEHLNGSLLAAWLRDATGPGELAIVDLASGATAFRATGVIRYAAAPGGDFLLALIEELSPDRSSATLFLERIGRDGKVEKLASPFVYSGDLGFAVSFPGNRIAVGGPGQLDLISVKPLARVSLSQPFGEKHHAHFHTLAWLDEGQRLVAAASEYLSEQRKMDNRVAILAPTGAVQQRLPDTVLAGTTERDFRVQQGTEVFAVSPDGGLTPAARLVTQYPDSGKCEFDTGQKLLGLMLVGNGGILLPAPR